MTLLGYLLSGLEREKPTAMKIRVESEDTGGQISFAFRAYCDDQACGRIYAYRSKAKVSGKVVYAVKNIEVNEVARRKGVGTKLYEAAANEACRRRGSLASVGRNPGAHSNDFWEKQAAKGRAVRVRQPGGQPAFVLVECPSKGMRTDLSGVQRKRKS